MRKMIRNMVMFLALVLSLASCVHQWPETVPTSVRLKFEFDRTMDPYDTLFYETKAAMNQTHDVRYVVEAYKVKPNGDYYRQAAAREIYTKDEVDNLDHDVVITVPDEGTYIIKAWADFVDQGSTSHKYYNPDKFNEIVIHKHEGNNEFREAYIGTVEVQVVRYGMHVPLVEGVLKMTRPVAKYEFISDGLAEFIEKETRLLNERENLTGLASKALDLNDYVVRIYYTGFMPSAFNMHSNRPNDSKTGVFYESKIVQIGEDEAKIGFDYVLANPDDASVVAAVALYDKDGNEIASTIDIHIPLKRGMLTTVKGAFLMKESSGGVSINPDFDGEFNIIL